jgi:cytidylate kinase
VPHTNIVKNISDSIKIIKFVILNRTKMHIPDIIIAIDGYSSTGKSSFAKLIASRLGYLYLDSGALYRGVTLFAMENGFIDEDCKIDEEGLKDALSRLDLHFEDNGDGSKTYMGSRCIETEIRSLEIASKVSPISAVAAVRNYVDGKLREFGKAKKVVMDGRDIGTTVFPNAELKLFMTADTDIRAHRRAAEMMTKGQTVDIEDVKKNLQERDYIDSHREVSPLTQAEDAIVLDNSYMTFDQQMEWVMNLITQKFGK